MKPFFSHSISFSRFLFARVSFRRDRRKKVYLNVKLLKFSTFFIYLHFNLDRPNIFERLTFLMKHNNFLIRFVVVAAYNCHSRFIMLLWLASYGGNQETHKSQMNTQKPLNCWRHFRHFFFGCTTVSYFSHSWYYNVRWWTTQCSGFWDFFPSLQCY